MQLTHPTPQLLELFSQPHLDFVVQAMIEGNSPAMVWMDDAGETALIWDKSHCLYLAGNLHHPRLQETITTALLPLARPFNVLKISLTSDEQAGNIPLLFPECRQETYPRSLFRLHPSTANRTAFEAPDGFQTQLIDHALLDDTQRPGHTNLVEEIELCWVSLDRFLENGFGVCVLDEAGTIVCRCTAEYVSPQVCGVGIATYEPVMRRGLATAAAQAFVQQAAERNWTVYWDSWTNNLPSVRVAQKVSFELVTNYNAVLIFFNN